MRKTISDRHAVWALLLMVVLFLAPGCAAQRTFSSPDQAVDSLVGALRSGDSERLREVLGPSDILSSGDQVSDRNDIETFLAAYDQKHRLVPADDDAMNLIVGPKDWPMPIPIVKVEGKDAWRFDTAAGEDEIINRRVGRNELNTIQTCLAIMDAQREYAMQDPDHDGVPAYAQKFLSDPGRKNGLYWQTAEGEKPSPLGAFVAAAEEQGYSRSTPKNGRRPYHGYFFRILTAQGPNASGGARDYMLGKELIGGFAVVAYPADYGKSGIMTFIMNQEGVVYQRDLGSDTAKNAEKMTTFDPDSHWRKVEPTDPAAP